MFNVLLLSMPVVSSTKLCISGFTLFILYINDLIKSLPNDVVTTCFMFDNSSIIITSLKKQAFENPTLLKITIEHNWSWTWKVNLNVNINEVSLFSVRQNDSKNDQLLPLLFPLRGKDFLILLF